MLHGQKFGVVLVGPICFRDGPNMYAFVRHPWRRMCFGHLTLWVQNCQTVEYI